MIDFLLFLWQLPQNILGVLVMLVTGSYKTSTPYEWINYRFQFGVCLGDYIIFGCRNGMRSTNSYNHEAGHHLQSRMLGPLYLIIIGLPSILGNICDKVFHKEWDMQSRYYWYYSLPWEHWADKLGGVAR